MNTASDVINQALKALSETTASGQVSAGLYGGSGELGSPVIPGNDQLLFWASEAQKQTTRLCLPIQDYAAVQAPSAGAQTLCSFKNLLSQATGRQLFTASKLYIGGNQLEATSAGYIRAQNFYPPAINGDPTAWSNLGTSIGLSAYTTTPWVTVVGYALPVDLTSLTQTLDEYLDDDAQIAMWAYIAWRMATSNQDNTVLAERAGWCMQEFATKVRTIYERLVGNDANLSASFLPTGINAQVEIMKAQTPNT